LTYCSTSRNELVAPPDPDQFFRARIEISKPEIRVYVNDDAEPSLVVNELSDRTGGRIGLWMGNNSDGSFAELVIRQEGN
jgi:ssDNA-binding replication factor A large subunit